MRLDGTQSKVRIANFLSSSFPIENGLKEGYAIGAIHKLRHTLRGGEGRRSVALCDKGGEGS